MPPPPAPGADTTRIWKEAFLVLAVSDVRGIKEAGAARVGEITHGFVPGALDTQIRSGLHANLGSAAKLESELAFRIPLELAGTTYLKIAPVGSQTEIRLDSEWPHPSFIGGYPPDRREISASGFSATWRVNHFATGGNAFWLGAVPATSCLPPRAWWASRSPTRSISTACPTARPSTGFCSCCSPSLRSRWSKPSGACACTRCSTRWPASRSRSSSCC